MKAVSQSKKGLKTTGNQELGHWGENVAANFLVKAGYEILEQNFRTREGEIDLIVKKDAELVFVEVKTRKNTEFSLPEDAINDEKLDHLEIAAAYYLEKHPEYDENWRLDVITVVGSFSGDPPQIDWFENVTG